MHVGLHTRLKPGAEQRYEEAHAAVWPEILEAIRAAGVARGLIFRDGLDLFHVAHDHSGAADDKLRLIFDL